MTRDPRRLWLAEIAPNATYDDYHPATAEQNQVGLQAIHTLLYGEPLELPHAVDASKCDDCDHKRPVLYTFGNVTICVDCFHSRYAVARQLAKDEAA